jgi:hypothetical protein
MLTTTRNFLLTALVGVLIVLAARAVAGATGGASDSAALLLGAMIGGAALTAFSLVPPALRMLVRGWARVGIGPREPRAAQRLADMIAMAVWALWLIGGAMALPRAWAPLLANFGMN